jgi:putative hemolysin
MGARILNRGTRHHHYTVRFAAGAADIEAAQALRFQVFNLELNEGLQESYATGLDADPFDAVCDHLLVENVETGMVVGTYRLQTGRKAAEAIGYYSAQEFHFTPYESFRSEIVELGRACVDREHRNLTVLGLLWRAIATYAADHRCRYLIGCSSLSSVDARQGASMYSTLIRKYLAAPALRTAPLPAYECPLDELPEEPPRIPKLLLAYLSLGAKICSVPAIDRQFGTIDFLTVLDIQDLPEAARSVLA